MAKHNEAATLRKVAAFIAAGKNRVRSPWEGYHGACDVLSCRILGKRSFQRPALRSTFYDLFVEGEGYRLMDDLMGEEDAQNCRVLALLFMAAMVETGDA